MTDFAHRKRQLCLELVMPHLIGENLVRHRIFGDHSTMTRVKQRDLRMKYLYDQFKLRVIDLLDTTRSQPAALEEVYGMLIKESTYGKGPLDTAHDLVLGDEGYCDCAGCDVQRFCTLATIVGTMFDRLHLYPDLTLFELYCERAERCAAMERRQQRNDTILEISRMTTEYWHGRLLGNFVPL